MLHVVLRDIYPHKVLHNSKTIGVEGCINFRVIKITLTITLTNHVVGAESTLVQIPTIPLKVNLLDFVDDIVEDCDIAHIKTTSASHKNNGLYGESSNSQQKKAKETHLEDRPKKKHSRRNI